MICPLICYDGPMAAVNKRVPFVPDPSQMALWPEISGNAINGLGEKAKRRPSPVYWHEPDTIPHGPLQGWFAENYANSTEVVAARERRQAVIDQPLPGVAEARRDETPARWSELVTQKAIEFGADDAGIARMDPDWIFEGHVLGLRHRHCGLARLRGAENGARRPRRGRGHQPVRPGLEGGAGADRLDSRAGLGR